MTFRSEANTNRERVLSRRTKDLKKYHSGHKSIKKWESQLKEVKAKNREREEKIKANEKKIVSNANKEASPPKAGIKQQVSQEQRSQENNKPVWNPQEQMAKRYYANNPNVQSEQYFSNVKDKEGNVKGYTDKLNKQSVSLKKDETITDEALEKANKRATALVNISKGKVSKKDKVKAVADKENAITSVYTGDKKVFGTYTAAPEQGFFSSYSKKGIPFSLSGLEEGIKREKQKFETAQSAGLPLQSAGRAALVYTGKAIHTIASFPKTIAAATVAATTFFASLTDTTVKKTITAAIDLKSGIDTYENLTGDSIDIRDISSERFVLAGKKVGKKVSSDVGAAVDVVAVAGAAALSKAGDDPVGAAVEVITSVVAPTIWAKVAQKVVGTSKVILAGIGLKYRNPTDIFSPESLASSGKLPNTKSTAETITAFKSTAKNIDKIDDVFVLNVIDDVADDVVLGHYSYKDSGINPNTGKPGTSTGFYNKGFKEKPLGSSVYSEVIPEEQLTAAHITQADFGKSGKFMSGSAGEAGVQDPGLFVSSGDHLSPLRIGDGASSSTEYSFNPFKWLESLKGSGTSKGYKIAFKHLDTLPDEILNQPGFSGVKTYHATRVGDETAFITKRSTIGHGEIKPKTYTVADDFVLKDKTTKAGTRLLEKGTVEEEAVFPTNTLYEFGVARKNVIQKLLKAEEYTYYNDQLILLTSGKVTKGSGIVDDAVSSVKAVTGVSRSPVDESVSRGSEILSGRDIVSSSRGVNPNTVYVDPVSSGASFLASATGIGLGEVSVVSSSSGDSAIARSFFVSPDISKVSSKPSDSVSVVSSKPSGRSSGRSSSSSPVSPSSSSIVDSSSDVSSSPSSISVVSSSASSIGSSSSPVSPSSSSFYSIIGSSGSSSSSKPSSPKFKSDRNIFGDLFSAQVRKAGKWVTVDPGFGFSQSEALNKGLSVVGTSARASTRIVKASAGSKKKRFYGIGILGNFYKKGNVFIEKRGKRIKSKGELEEITYKGQRAIKSKSIMSKMGLFK